MTNEQFEETRSQTDQANPDGDQGTVGRMSWDQPTTTRDYPAEAQPGVALDDSEPSPATSDQVDSAVALSEDEDSE